MRITKLFISLAASIIATGSVQAQQTYNIHGTATGLDGTVVRLTTEDKQPIDSAVITDGTFQLSGPLKVQVAMLRTDGASEAFILHEKPIEVTLSKVQRERKGKTFGATELTIVGDHEHDLMKQVNDMVLFETMTMLAVAMGGKEQSEAMRDSMAQMYQYIKQRKDHVLDSIATNCPDNYAAAFAMNQFLAKSKTYAELKPQYDRLSPRVLNSALGQQLTETMQRLNAVGIGSVAPDITLPTPEGKELSLQSLRGQVVLIDFWASWCGPCLREAPNVRRVYEKYHDRGFQVFGVSLDNEKQRDAWLKAIEKHQLTWPHVSSLKGWECPAAKLYNVTAIPATFLLDRDGRIVATNCRGEKLEEEVAKLCK